MCLNKAKKNFLQEEKLQFTMDMMAYHRSDDITIDLMAATIDMMTGLPISAKYTYRVSKDR